MSHKACQNNLVMELYLAVFANTCSDATGLVNISSSFQVIIVTRIETPSNTETTNMCLS
jgi:hypothetical protein